MKEHMLSLALLRFAYLSAVVLIALFTLSSYALSARILSQEVSIRALATDLHLQAIRAQRLQRNSLLLIPKGDHRSILAVMRTDLPQWQATQKALEANHTSSDLVKGLAAVHGTFLSMSRNCTLLLTMEQETWKSEKAREQAEIPLISTIFYDELSYVSAMELAFTRINAEANAQIATIQVSETVICGFTLLTLVAEYLIVIRPALRRLQQASLIPLTTGKEEKQPT